MDGDGGLQPEEELNAGKATSTGIGQCEGGVPVKARELTGTEEENTDVTGDNGKEEGDDDSEEGDTPDGDPPSSIQEQVFKRRHVQSRRMQEYHAMQKMTSHEKQRLFHCLYCQRTFSSGPGLRYHMQTHYSSNESFTCDMCHKEFKSNNGLKYHRKKNRCQGHPSNATPSLNDTQGPRIPRPLILPGAQDCGNQRLMELAQIATGPQSPLLRNSQDQWKCATDVGDQFDSPETSAVMALSSMAERSRQTRRFRTGHDDRGSQPLPSGIKSKRPMNGFLLFAQKNRAAFNKRFSLNNRIISTKLSEAWNNLSVDERQSWKEEAKKKAEQQRLEHPDCWKRKKYSKDGR